MNVWAAVDSLEIDDASFVTLRGQSERGKSPDEALAFLANTLTNKLLHHPSARLREAALSGDMELLQAAERLYGVDEDLS